MWPISSSEILVPTEEVVEVKRGAKVSSERKFFPGYVLIKMDLSDETWHLVKNTAKVTGFLGGRGRPSPISEHEAARIMHQVQEGIERPKPSITFEVGEQVRVCDGPFTSFNGLGRGRRRGEGAGQGRGVDLWPRNPGRARILAGREGVSGHEAKRASPAKAGDQWLNGRSRRRHEPRRCAGRADQREVMAKKVVGIIKLQVPAGKANPSPPIGPALGQRGLNIMEFCKAFNAATQSLEPGMPIPVVITAFGDRSFTFVTKSPPNSYFLKKAAGVEKGSQTTGKGSTVGRVTMSQIREIAEKKMPDLNAKDVEGACRMLVGSARSMGLEVVRVKNNGENRQAVEEGV